MHKQIIINIPLDEFGDYCKVLFAEVLEKHTQLQQKCNVPELLTKQETAELLNVSLSSVHNYTKQGRLIAQRVGNRILYSREQILQSLQIVERLKYK